MGVWVTSGVVAPAAAVALLGHCQDWLAETGASGLVADYQQARLAIDADALYRSAVNVVAQGGALATPTALLVRRDDLEKWQRYALLMAQAGIVRRAFTCPDAATAWAVEEARIMRLQRAWRLAPPCPAAG